MPCFFTIKRDLKPKRVIGTTGAVGLHFADKPAVKRHPHRKDSPARRRRRHRRARAVVVGAMMFVPHAGRGPARTRENPPATVTQFSVGSMLVPDVTFTTAFRLPPNLAFETLIQEAAAQHQVDPALVRAVVRAESGFDPMAVSSAGAQGLMQLMPELSDELGVIDPFDPRENIFAGVRYLAWLLTTNGGDETLALASFNAGPAAVAAYAGVPPFPETQQYVRTITDRLARERALAPSAPDQPHDDRR